MRIVVIGGTGLIGSKLVTQARRARPRGGGGVARHRASTPSPARDSPKPSTGASVVVDVSNSPSFEDAAVLEFFETSTRNLLAAEAAAGVGHHVALSVVGTERLPESGYFRAKIAQEKLIKESSIPYSIVHATQFFEFVKSIADGGHRRRHGAPAARARSSRSRPTTSPTRSARVAVGAAAERHRRGRRARAVPARRVHPASACARGNDPREVVTDPHARYFGAELSERTLVPGDDARLGAVRLEDWLSR